ncbi:protein SSUH2 homolog isoform X1 [Scyliorhinus canicula]|uniref:protein SSUH2 homolog isoform X1 n=1 Tax=Scyliorhinus canicula TaxID=7830 RepID=UPI0018F4E84B|nr:protein SSUH2 homolog isoform X1 [Scyliorhinus canicula]
MDPQQWSAHGNPPMATLGPTAPPASMLDTVAGYESIPMGGEERYLPPPVYPGPNAMGGQSQPVQQWSIPSINEDTARQALIKYASDHVTYSSRPAEEMVLKEFKPYSMYRYCLESFTESRSPEWKSEPYQNQIIDNYGYPPPPPWEVAVDVPKMFEKNKKKVKVPHTASVKGCHRCMAMGKVPCNKCLQTGRMKCWICSGKGFRLGDERCNHCMGSGIQSCKNCSGLGCQKCNECQGRGQLFFYIQLTVKWENNKFEHIVEQQCGFPTERFSKVTGLKLFHDQQIQVYPIMDFPDSRIQQVSKQGIQEHWTQFGKTSRIIQQRHTIELIPVTEVHFQWKRKDYSYFVYGTENKVHAPEYPGKNCTIM